MWALSDGLAVCGRQVAGRMSSELSCRLCPSSSMLVVAAFLLLASLVEVFLADVPRWYNLLACSSFLCLPALPFARGRCCPFHGRRGHAVPWMLGGLGAGHLGQTYRRPS